MNVGERLKEWRAKIGVSQKEASSITGVSFSTYQNYEMDISPPGAKSLQCFWQAGISIDWLLSGEGEMFLEKSLVYQGKDSAAIHHQISEKSAHVVSSKNEHKESLWQDFELVPYYDMEISAGHGSFVDQQLTTGYIAFRKDWLQQRNLQASNLITTTGRGDSMEKTIYHGDLLLIDKSINRIIDDSIYVLRIGSHTIIKRIQQSFDGSLTIISDNEIYAKQIIRPEQAEDLDVVGRVKWYGHEI